MLRFLLSKNDQYSVERNLLYSKRTLQEEVEVTSTLERTLDDDHSFLSYWIVDGNSSLRSWRPRPVLIKAGHFISEFIHEQMPIVADSLSR
jgi:hypothetical protein